MSIFGSIFKKQAPINNPTPKQSVSSAVVVAEAKTQKHRITGVSHYEKNIMKLAIKNPDYSLTPKQIISSKLEDEKIYQYIFKPTKTDLIPEPTNEHDPNAIKVLIDGEHVGYIKAGSCSRVLKLINEDQIAKIDCRIRGGAYKYICICGDDGEYESEKGKDSFSVEITINEK